MAAELNSCLLPGCVIDRVEQGEQGLIISAHVSGSVATCPTCKQSSMGVHSSYTRSPSDLPLGEQAVRLRLQVRRFRCSNPACARQTFVERLPELVPVHAQCTARLTRTLREVGFALGGEAGARLLGRMQISTSARTLLRLLRTEPESSACAVRVLGVDDWAMCKGRTYGTILVDLERHKPVDLLPDRGAATVAAWLRNHPEVEIVTRDRSTEYARGVSEGAPTGLQVADRWHLLQNLRQMLERLIQRLYPQLQQLPADGEGKPPAGTQTTLPRSRLRMNPKDKEAMAASRARSQSTHQQVQRLRNTGLNIRQIARKLKMSRTTVRKYFYSEAFPERAKRRTTQSMLDAYLPYLESRHQVGCENAKQLWRELCEQGYPGAYVQVSRWLRQRRQAVAASTPGPYREAVSRGIQERAEQTKPKELPSYKPLAWLLIQEPETLEASETTTLNRICQEAQIEQAYQLAQQFRTMVRQHESSVLDSWLEACATSGVCDLVTFAGGLRQDYAAVRAALATQWSNGQTEGQVNRLKFLKRQMYGRANFDLLRRRVLHPN
ncbi:MAG: ISL3 family transposase [Caldilineaceae bacterium]|nr:ISL3 family transposase [Caldilineaceae bacterium]